jgi:anti-sigma28 factor (negative regulator of flagellin synthesis)
MQVSDTEGEGYSNIQQHHDQAQTSHTEDQQTDKPDLSSLGYSGLGQHHAQVQTQHAEDQEIGESEVEDLKNDIKRKS